MNAPVRSIESTGVTSADADALGRAAYRADRELTDRLREEPSEPVAAYIKGYRKAARQDALASWSRRLVVPALLRNHVQPLGQKLATPVRPHVLGRAAAGLAGVAMLSAGLALAIAWPQAGAMVRVAEQQMACSELTAFMRAGEILAVSHDRSIITCRQERLDLKRPGQPDAAIETRPHLTLPFEDPALVQELAAMIGYIEGAYRRGATVFGHDPKGFIRYAGSKLGVMAEGGSAPILSAFESLVGEPGSMDRVDKYWRKIVAVIASARFTFEHLPDDASRAQFLVNHMPVVRGYGFPRGGRLGAEALFGGPPKTLFQKCQFARAAGYPVELARPAEPVGRDAGRSWARSVGPSTAKCIDHFADSEAQAKRAQHQLVAACDGTTLCKSPGSETAGRSEAQVVQGHERRDEPRAQAAQRHAPRIGQINQLDAGARRVLTNALQLSNEDGRNRVQIPLNPTAQARLAERMPDVKRAVAEALPAGTCMTGSCPGKVFATVAVAEITKTGPVLRAVHASRYGDIFGRAVWREGRYVAAPPRMPLASLHKMLLVPVATRNGVGRLCTLPHGRGDRACTGGTWISLERAVARSDNDAFRWLARHYADDVTAIQDAVGLKGSPAPDPAFGAVFGLGRVAPPERFFAYAAALANAGQSAGLRVLEAPITEPIQLGATGYETAAIREAREKLAAPLRPGGTLAGMARGVDVPGCDLLFGKSGSHAEGGETLRRNSLVVARCGQRRFVTYASAHRNGADHGINELHHKNLAPFHRAALSAVAAVD